ncbi:MAG: hypothetical protein ACFE0Q_09690 [Anaerolineae bacterium]
MNRGQTNGIIAIVSGLVLTIIASIILSFLAVDRLNPSQVVIASVVIFLFLAPLFGYGIFTYARSAEAQMLITNEEMVKPRQLYEMLFTNTPQNINTLATALDSSPEQIRVYIEELVQLGLFSGYANWQTGEIQLLQRFVIKSLDQCAICSQQISINALEQTCSHCYTTYYQAEPL